MQKISLPETNVMLDLETMGLGESAVIVSIGAVQFSAAGLGETFKINLDMADAARQGMTLEAGTVRWWLDQSQQATQRALSRPVKVSTALDLFDAWVRAYAAPEKVAVWGNGVDFDNVKLAMAYQRMGMEPPWKFWNNRCYRTIKGLLGGAVQNQLIKPEIAHDALSDAVAQATNLLIMTGHITPAG